MLTVQEMKSRVSAEIDRRGEQLVRIAKTILGSPEPGFREHRTARLVRDTFESYGIDHQTGITITGVKLSGDLSRAEISVSVMGSEAEKRTTMKGLDGARGFVQKAVARALDTRTTPHIQFVLDESIDKSIEFADLLKKIRDERENESRREEPGAGEG